MKTLRLGIFSLLAIFAVSVFLTSCEKEDDNTKTPDYDNPSFIKEITTQGINDSENFQFVIEVASNSEILLNSFDHESITMEFLNQNTIDDLIQAESNADDNAGSQAPEEDEQVSNGDTFVRITLKSIIAPYSLLNISPYELKINPAVNEIIKEMNATTVIDFEQSIQVANSNNISSRVDFWNFNKKVMLLGDCGTKWTRTRNYWEFTNQHFNSANPRTINTTWFKCYRHVSVCCLGGNGNKWVRRVVVLNDVLAKAIPFSNSCNGSNWCSLSADNSCSGYYPNGCWN